MNHLIRLDGLYGPVVMMNNTIIGYWVNKSDIIEFIEVQFGNLVIKVKNTQENIDKIEKVLNI